MPSFIKTGGAARRNPRFPFEIKSRQIGIFFLRSAITGRASKKNAEMPVFNLNGGAELGGY